MRIRTIACGALAALVFGSVSLAASQAQTGPVAPPPAELEQFRRDLGKTLTDLDQQLARLNANPLVQKATGGRGLSHAETARNAQDALQQLTPEQLGLLYRGAAATNQDWRNAPTVFGQLADTAGSGGAEAKSANGTVAQAVSPDDCQLAFAENPSWTDWSVAKLFAIGLQAGYEVVPEVVNIPLVAAWVGVEEGATYLEYLNVLYDRCSGDQAQAEMLSAIANINNKLEVINANVSSLSGQILNVKNAVNDAKTAIIDNINSNTNTLSTAVTDAKTAIVNNDNTNTSALNTSITDAKAQIVNNDNTNTSTINTSITNAKTAIIDNDNANTSTINTSITNAKTAIIDNDNANSAALKDLTLRTQIEADLAEADSATPVGLYLTPNAQGGHLDDVQRIVTETLANIEAAGGTIGQARSFLDQANALKSSGKFKDAYKNYRKAYKAAVS